MIVHTVGEYQHRIQELLEANSRYVEERQEARNRAEISERIAKDAIADMNAIMREYGGEVYVDDFPIWIRIRLEELKILQRQDSESGFAKMRADRDRLGATISEIRKILIAEGCGGHGTSTTELVKAAASFVNRCGPVGTFERIRAITDALTKILHPSSMPVTGTPKHVLDVLETAVSDVGRRFGGFEKVKAKHEEQMKRKGEESASLAKQLVEIRELLASMGIKPGLRTTKDMLLEVAKRMGFQSVNDTAKAGDESRPKAPDDQSESGSGHVISHGERLAAMEKAIRDHQRQLESIRARMAEDNSELQRRR